MRIALDYDGTYTIDAPMWDWIIGALLRAGHEVRIVTIRDDRHDRTLPLIELEKRVPIIFTRGVAKAWWCLHHAQWVPDIYVDDSPRSILENSSATPEWLATWRTTRDEIAGPAETAPCPVCGLRTPHHPDHSLP